LRRIGILALALVAIAPPAGGQVLHTRESALALAFPEADDVVPRPVILSEAQFGRVRELAGSTPDSRLLTVYEGRTGGRTTGWAIFDTRVVRTSPETLLIVLDAQGDVAATHLVAFHEPPEYRPVAAWLRRFAGRALDGHLAVGRGVDGISGATLTSHAVTAAVRRALAIHRVMIDEAGTS